MVAEAEENNLDWEAKNSRFRRWNTCSLCEQSYHGVVRGALGWACWKTYVGRPEADDTRRLAINQLGNGLSETEHYEAALSVREAELAMERRLGTCEEGILVTQSNLATNYHRVGRYDESLRLLGDLYSGHLKIYGNMNRRTLIAANNYAWGLFYARRFEEAKALMRKTIPVARRVLGDSYDLTLMMRWVYARALYLDTDATLDDLREAATSLEETERIARRVLGSAHPDVSSMENALQEARAALAAREGTKIN